jgi:putative sigma-54 modulation protein
MQLTITGHHVDVTPALHAYVTEKMQRINRHFDSVISLNVILSVEKLEHGAEATLHAAGKSLVANAIELDMYAAIDSLVDKLDKQVRRYKDKRSDHQVSRDDKQASLG